MNPYERLRYETGKNRAEVADESGVHVDAIRRLEDGRVTKPTPAVAKPLAAYYGKDLVEFMELGTTERSAS